MMTKTRSSGNHQVAGYLVIRMKGGPRRDERYLSVENPRPTKSHDVQNPPRLMGKTGNAVLLSFQSQVR